MFLCEKISDISNYLTMPPVKPDESEPSAKLMDDLKKFIATQFQDFSKCLNHNEELVKSLTLSLENISTKLQETNQRCDALEKENSVLRSNVYDLQSELLELQQYSRRTNIEISGIPESDQEDLSLILSALFGNDHVNECVSVVHRVPTSRKDRHKNIVVQFNSKENRDFYLSSYKKCNKNANDVNKQFDKTPIYVNEHLAPKLKRLLFLAKSFKRDHNFKFAWVKDGKVFVKQKEDSRAFRIRSEEDFSSVSVV